MTLLPFHLAIPVHDIKAAKSFYVGILRCGLGRESKHWVDFDFYGHQVVAHLHEEMATEPHKNPVDGDSIPVPHFGLVLEWERWHELKAHIENAKIPFIVPPKIRFEGKAGEQATMFFRDPSGNALEFKAFKNPEALFATGEQ
ncbi:MAG: VOC family protein [Planctomycetes bacterium]|nr:VOC family protein [Planctomycetota bacterium]